MRFSLLLLTLLALFSCSTLTDNVVSSIDEESMRKTEALYHELLRAYLDLPLMSTREGVEKELALLRERETYNRDFEARVLGLNALWAHLEGKESRARAYLDSLEKTNRPGELSYITPALLSEDPVTLLREGEKNLYETKYLPLFLGEESYKKGDFGTALSYFEKAEPVLPPDLASFVKGRMDTSLQLYLSPVANESGREIMEKEELTLSDLIGYFHGQTDIFYELDGREEETTWANWVGEQLLLPKDKPDAVLLRRKLANILYRMDWYRVHAHDPFPGTVVLTLPDEYAYLEVSPVSDVSLDDPDFPAILMVIEREWINMVDGEHFSPDRPVRGEELLPLMEKLPGYFH